MNSAIALFFASLVSGMLSMADFRPTFSDVVQILTGVELDALESADAPAKTQQAHNTQSDAAKCLSQQETPS